MIKIEKSYVLNDGTLIYPVVNKKARRLKIRIDSNNGNFILVLPRESYLKKGITFANESLNWMHDHKIEVPLKISFEDGMKICLLGEEIILKKIENINKNTWLESNILYVPNPRNQNHFENMVKDFLKKYFLEYSTKEAINYSNILNVKILGLELKDNKTKWGSCNSKSKIVLSWRLVLAPKEIANYVIAHEVSHLKEMNHSVKFWQIVEILDENYKKHREWLKNNGKLLQNFK
ncbi:MAG: M48 family metallopeptidase [Alphaproteobacteria bacterium]|nr:M48 family metallopeptidase [Alphaproteobacteria bacterium]